MLLPCWTTSTVAHFWVCKIYTGNSLLPTMNKGACLGILLGSGPVVCSKARVNRQRMWMWLVMVGVVVSPLLIKTLGFLPMANVHLHYNIISYIRHAAHSYRKKVRFTTHSFCVWVIESPCYLFLRVCVETQRKSTPKCIWLTDRWPFTEAAAARWLQEAGGGIVCGYTPDV